METLIPIHELKIVGGNVALDFANTESGPPDGTPDIESLASYDDLLAWGQYVGILQGEEVETLRRLADRQPEQARRSFGRAMALREQLFDVFGPIARGRPPGATAVRRLQALAAQADKHAELVGTDARFERRWTSTDDLDRPLWPIAHAGLELLVTGPLDRIKGCGLCRYVFLDETKNRSRRWCSMDDCGTKAKTRNFVARRAARRKATPARSS